MKNTSHLVLNDQGKDRARVKPHLKLDLSLQTVFPRNIRSDNGLSVLEHPCHCPGGRRSDYRLQVVIRKASLGDARVGSTLGFTLE